MAEAELDPEIAALLSNTESTVSIEDIENMPSASDSFNP